MNYITAMLTKVNHRLAQGGQMVGSSASILSTFINNQQAV